METATHQSGEDLLIQGLMDKISVKMHLLMCGQCRTFIGSLRASVDLINAHSSQEPDEELLRRIDERVAESLSSSWYRLSPHKAPYKSALTSASPRLPDRSPLPTS